MTDARIGGIRRDLIEARDLVEPLWYARAGATRVPRPIVPLSTERLAELIERDKAERAERLSGGRCGVHRASPGNHTRTCLLCRQTVTQARGEAPLPVPAHLLDALPGILADADMLADLVCQAAGVDKLDHAAHAYADPRPYLATADRWLAQAVEAVPGLLEEASDLARTILAECRAALAVTDVVQVLNAECPWCRGRRLTVRRVGTEPLVVCEAQDRACEPPETDCGVQHRGRPAWREYEWEWLLGRIRHAEGAA